MNTNFREWMLKRENSLDTTSFYNPNTQSNNTSQLSYSQNQPTQNSSWQMNLFQNWYNSNRGNWGEVVKAAQINPNIQEFIKKIDKSLSQDGLGGIKSNINAYGDEEFDINQPTRMEQLADNLENMVRKVIPNHRSPYQNSSYPKVQPMNKMNQTKVSQKPDSIHSKLQDMQNRAQNPDTSQLIDVVRTLILRIDDIERRINSVR